MRIPLDLVEGSFVQLTKSHVRRERAEGKNRQTRAHAAGNCTIKILIKHMFNLTGYLYFISLLPVALAFHSQSK